jgi:hypothetical protein
MDSQPHLVNIRIGYADSANSQRTDGITVCKFGTRGHGDLAGEENCDFDQSLSAQVVVAWSLLLNKLVEVTTSGALNVLEGDRREQSRDPRDHIERSYRRNG